MKLSEAILLGSTLKPQAFGDNFVNGGSCAFGAAWDAVGDSGRFPRMLWPWIENPQQCPVCHEWERIGASVISMHLNDTHRWTREQIADWVATVEPSEPETKGEQADVEAFERAQ
jgi:hypothetical protein